MIRLTALVALAWPVAAVGQSLSCPLPRVTPRPFVERVPADREPDTRPITGYVLALSWSPQYCAGRDNARRDALQCRDGRFGFVLHGLWPQGRGGAPAWCAYAPRLPARLIRANLCITPSAQLIQHQWAKHGVCATSDPRDYLRASAKLFRMVRFPDMRRSYRIGTFRDAFAAANPWFPRSAVGTATTRGGWLVEVNLCLSERLRPRPCNAYERGREDWRPLRIRPVRG